MAKGSKKEFATVFEINGKTYPVLRCSRGYWRHQDEHGRPSVTSSPLPLTLVVKPNKEGFDKLLEGMAKTGTYYKAELKEADPLKPGSYANTVVYNDAKVVDLLFEMDAVNGLTVQLLVTYKSVKEGNVEVDRVTRMFG